MTKKRLVAIGVNTENNLCTCIYSYATFKQLEENYTIYHKEYRSTDWQGCDEVARTLELEKLELTGKTFTHNEVVNGVDHDMGHEYDWRFSFDTVMEVKKVKSAETKSAVIDKNEVISKLSNIIEEEKSNGKDTTILSKALLVLKENYEND